VTHRCQDHNPCPWSWVQVTVPTGEHARWCVAKAPLRGCVEARARHPVRGDVAQDEVRECAGAACPAPGILGPKTGAGAILVLVVLVATAAILPRECGIGAVPRSEACVRIEGRERTSTCAASVPAEKLLLPLRSVGGKEVVMPAMCRATRRTRGGPPMS